MSRVSLRRLAQVGLLGLPMVGIACKQIQTVEPVQPAPMQVLPHSPVDPAMSAPFSHRESLVEPMDSQLAAVAPEPPAATVRAQAVGVVQERQTLPISLDTVLRLAEEQNPQIAVARTRVNAAFAEKQAINANKLPDIFVGVGYYRHAGGIQLQEGPLINSTTGAFQFGGILNAEYNPREHAFRQVDAARKVYQNKGELARISYEQLLEASTTYIDLLAAHAALAISRDLESKVKEVYEKALKAFEMNKTAEFEIEKTRAEAELTVQQQTQTKLKGQIEAASAKLVYLLGLDPTIDLVPIDGQMVAFHLVDLQRPIDDLVNQALTSGPGVRELESLLRLIQAGLDDAQGITRYVPIVKLQMGEGLFAAGPGGTLDWSNRWDMGLQARWNISEFFTARFKRNIVLAQMNQAQMTYQDLRAKLTLGVQEAKSTIEAAAQQFPTSEKLIKDGLIVVERVAARVEAVLPGTTYSDLVQAHKAVAMAQLNYIDYMREYDKAQLRLLVLLGAGGDTCR